MPDGQESVCSGARRTITANNLLIENKLLPLSAVYTLIIMNNMKITNGAFVALSYQLNIGEGDEKELIEEATVEAPMSFILGMGSMIPAFEKQLFGLEKGAKFAFSLSPQEAHGEFSEEHIVDLPKSVFEVDGKFDEKVIFEGSLLPMTDSDGNRMTGFVLSVDDDSVQMDFNHPLAGETLRFEGTVLDVHMASPEEIAATTATCDCDDCNSESGRSSGCSCGCKQ
jgi:FKBP-type peptidyl-prolyl cis-trans isomerase SlyD